MVGGGVPALIKVKIGSATRSFEVRHDGDGVRVQEVVAGQLLTVRDELVVHRVLQQVQHLRADARARKSAARRERRWAERSSV